MGMISKNDFILAIVSKGGGRDQQWLLLVSKPVELFLFPGMIPWWEGWSELRPRFSGSADDETDGTFRE